ncbi:MAG TPA: EAL domain-containing protein, partial [Euzebya sp.]|nr:EAL domain-containing protein [Euzebya sp.]
ALAGVEALIRWDHPTRGTVPPDEFIGEAERVGCINEITEFVLSTACREVAAWRHAELATTPEFTLSVNVSAVDLGDDALAARISEVLAETGLPSRWLHLELTETALMRDVEAVVNRLIALRLLGIRLAMDDFGTGESSLAHLHRFPIDVVKIDRYFLARLDDHDRGAVIARSVVTLAGALGHVTVAEGIETSMQARLVRDFGCAFGQGFLFSRPLRPEALRRILADPQGFADTNVKAGGLDAPLRAFSA